jgi:hypothetical protein
MKAQTLELMALTRCGVPVRISTGLFPENIARRFQAAVPFGGGGCNGRKSSPWFLPLPFTSPSR